MEIYTHINVCVDIYIYIYIILLLMISIIIYNNRNNDTSYHQSPGGCGGRDAGGHRGPAAGGPPRQHAPFNQ